MKPNIIFILLDGSRWDRLDISNEFSELKKEGSIFDNITTTAPYTFASVNTIFTGLYGKDNGVDAYYNMFKLKDSIEFLPEYLQNNGYFTSCNLISEKVISKRGFDIHQFHDEYTDNLLELHPKIIKESLEKAQGKPFFSFLQYSHIHTVTVSEILKKYDWDSQEFYDQKEENMKKYDESFIKAGQYAKHIFQTIQDLGIEKNTILIFFADHGTGIGERFGERNYGVFLHEETIRTFYLFIGPGISKNKNKSTLLSTIDILPTINELCELPIIEELPGISFGEALKNDTCIKDKEVTFSATGGLQGPFPSPNEPNVFCAKTKDHKLIYYKALDAWYFYDLKNDPNEEENIYDKENEIQKKLQEKLLFWIR
jgi:arylsulfatase A-like enzyme